MGVIEITLIGIGLAMDAFAVSICKGLSAAKLTWKHVLIPAVYFGVFQALMPLIGWLLGIQFQALITAIDHWIAFILLALIGANMIREALSGEEGTVDNSLSFPVMFMLAVATSIDALAIGITFAFLEVNIWMAVAVIGGITFVICVAGVKIGHVFGARFRTKAEILGGMILILIGVKILLEHLGIFL